MRDYIKPNCLSVGFNSQMGQPFFNMLQKYRQYIHSYFFSVTEDYMYSSPLDVDSEIGKISKLNTYDIPANILFNSVNPESNSRYEDIIDRLIGKINLTAVTVIDPDIGKRIKEKYPDLDIHISVRYFDADWKYLDNGGIHHLDEKIKTLEGIADVINLSHLSIHDIAIQHLCRAMGFKIKILVNEGCISHFHFNYSKLPGCESLTCYRDNKCKYDCSYVTSSYPFMELTRTYLYKEELKYIDYDILKFKSRDIAETRELERLISYWISPHRTNLISNIGISDNESYEVFLKLIRDRSRCNNVCADCMKCEEYYNLLCETGEVLDKNYGRMP